MVRLTFLALNCLADLPQSRLIQMVPPLEPLDTLDNIYDIDT